MIIDYEKIDHEEIIPTEIDNETRIKRYFIDESSNISISIQDALAATFSNNNNGGSSSSSTSPPSRRENAIYLLDKSSFIGSSTLNQTKQNGDSSSNEFSNLYNTLNSSLASLDLPSPPKLPKIVPISISPNVDEDQLEKEGGGGGVNANSFTSKQKSMINQDEWHLFLLQNLQSVSKASLSLEEPAQQSITIEPVPVPYDWNLAITNALANATLSIITSEEEQSQNEASTIPPSTFLNNGIEGGSGYAKGTTTMPPSTAATGLIEHSFQMNGIIMKLITSALLNNEASFTFQQVTSLHLHEALLVQIKSNQDKLFFNGNTSTASFRLETNFVNQSHDVLGNITDIASNNLHDRSLRHTRGFQKSYYLHSKDITKYNSDKEYYHEKDKDDHTRRSLQEQSKEEQNLALWIEFDLSFSVTLHHHQEKPNVTNADMIYKKALEEYVLNFFADSLEEASYISHLHRKNDAFNTVVDIQVYINQTYISAPIININETKATLPPIKEQEGGREGLTNKLMELMNENTGLLIGYTLLATVILLLIFYFTLCRNTKFMSRHFRCFSCAEKCKSKMGLSHKTDSTAKSSTDNDILPKKIIQVEVMEDVSTLGDPAFLAEARSQQKETITEAGFSVDYDYTGAFRIGPTQTVVSSVAATGIRTSDESEKSFQNSDYKFKIKKKTSSEPSILGVPLSVGNTTSTNTTTTNQSLYEQEEEEEEIIEIDAPTGKLGLFLDTPNTGGIPTVQAIKQSSILAQQLKVGDLLVSFNGIDTRRMQAASVSRLISQSMNSPTRKLIFVRRTNNWL